MPQYLTQFYPDLQDPRLESVGGGVPPALLDQHAAAVAARAPVPLSRPQRRDQHDSGQPQLGAGPRPAVPLAAAAGICADVLPLVSLTGSDSQSLDNMLEVLLMGGLDALHAMRLLMPPAWHGLDSHRPGPARVLRVLLRPHGAVGRSGGHRAHRRSLRRCARSIATDCVRRASCITKNRFLTIASETGVWDYAPEDVVRKGKLGPGDMIALDLQTGTLLESRGHRRAAEVTPSVQDLAEEGRALPRDRPRRSAAGRGADGSRDAHALSEDVQRQLGRARRDHPRARARTRARRSARWATTRRCRCCRTRSARSTTTSASSSRR